MRISPHLVNFAEVKQAELPYDVHAQCRARGWTGCAGDFGRHVHQKHPQLGVSMYIYRQ